MLKLLIIDDEEIICNTIASLIDWSSMGISLIGTCLDGVEAYHTILDESPDIVMTDIRMPGISGLELIERISHTDLHTQFIILSGHGEFEYAKTAMRCGVRHYLLKPCDENQIIECIRDVIKDCQEVMQSEELQKNQNLLIKNYQQTLVHNIIREGISLPELPDSFFLSYEHYINLVNTPYQFCCLYYLEQKNLENCLATITSYFSRHTPKLKVYQIYICNILILFFPNYGSDYQGMDEFLESLSFPGQSTSIVYERTSYPDLRSLLEALIQRLKRYDTLYFIDNQRLIPTFNYGHLVMQSNQLIPALISESDTEAAEACKELETILNSVSNRDFLMQLADNLTISLVTQISTYTLSEINQFLYDLHCKTDMEDIRTCTMSKVWEIVSLKSPGKEHYSDFIEKLLEYLKEHVAEPDLTLKWIAENYLYMNVNYVSRCFLKETGQKFSSYLMNLRVQKAKEIFATRDNEKIQNVAELVGCGNNPYYFSKIFKKATGMTPSAYVRKLSAPADSQTPK